MGSEYDVVFYEDDNGCQPVVEYMRLLQGENSKDARIKLTKIRDYVKLLKMNGPRLVEPYSKHLEGEIYELRPASNRIYYMRDGLERNTCFCMSLPRKPRKHLAERLTKRNASWKISRQDLKNEQEI